ncbi:phosphonate ABC transporter substrate-binding protein [Chelativorans salis]|uniref:Phosphonate ABC transporter substrate-binding protein n=1 Tax=Chelativorans salis TaxID=2978478 RepID=A0ABT2LGP9_9HYPH|nr:phosphonate ABC transporter substrate-binding protein [Chelativorans sp. EGI FJ00035]MCT7373686.1 phosphonate ABC transporter substrate-binding protein [Chelativorans sp. EGI FJ00035]
MKHIVITAGLIAGFLPANAAAEGWKDQYKTLRFGVLSSENEKDRIARYTAFENYLEKELGVEVEIFTAGSYDGVIQALAADQIEFAFLGSSAYAAAYTETGGGVIPLTTKQQEDGSTGYYSIVVVRCDSGYTSLDDLEGKVLAFADPDSTSGYAVPYFNMVKQGYEPETFFSAVPFSGAHETGVQGVVNGQYDAAATYQNNEINGIPQRMVAKGMIDEDVVCPIWESPEITSGPFTARANLPQDLIEAMQKAVLAVPEKDPEAFREMDGGETSTGKGFVTVDHPRYEWIIEMREWLKEQRRSG